MTEMRSGGCACGRVRYALTDAPLFVNCCHCRRCQRETGAAFALNALIEAARLRCDGDAPEPVAVPTDSGKPHRIFRCPDCRVAVWSEYGGTDKLKFVRVGALDDPDAFAPDAHIYTRSKLSWVQLPDGVPRFEAYYDARKVWPPASLERRRAAFA